MRFADGRRFLEKDEVIGQNIDGAFDSEFRVVVMAKMSAHRLNQSGKRT